MYAYVISKENIDEEECILDVTTKTHHCPLVPYMVYSPWCFSLMRSVYDDRYIASDVALWQTRTV